MGIRRAQLLAQSNYGRKFGWYIEYENEILGELTESLWVDQFWHSYKLDVTSNLGRQLLMDPDMWNSCVFRYRNKVLDEYIDNAISGSTSPEDLRDGRIWMRFLYLLPNGPLEKIVFSLSKHKKDGNE